MKILVTGANGFVGKALIERLTAEGMPVRAAVRMPATASALRAEHPQVEVVAIGDVGPATAWRDALARVDSVVRLTSAIAAMRDELALACVAPSIFELY